MRDQTIWLAPRATGFTEICESCEEDHPELVGKVSRADLLAQAEEVPEPS